MSRTAPANAVAPGSPVSSIAWARSRKSLKVASPARNAVAIATAAAGRLMAAWAAKRSIGSGARTHPTRTATQPVMIPAFQPMQATQDDTAHQAHLGNRDLSVNLGRV